jgi:hypothetical protein
MTITKEQVKASHTIDDLETRRARAHGLIASQIPLLQDGLHALRHGRYDVADEYMDRVLIALQDGLEKVRL